MGKIRLKIIARSVRRFVHTRLKAIETKFAGLNSSKPEKSILLGYLVYMMIGFAFLLLPWSTRHDVPWLDNLFMAVSALSTTGLATVDVPSTYTLFGQIVILFLIQIGVIGYMTVNSYILYLMTRHSGYTRPVMNISLARPEGMHLKELVYNVIHFTFIIEFLGFLAFWVIFSCAGTAVPAWNAVFLSVSSFCTAGFSPFSDSLCSFSGNIALNVTVAVLSYAGALGFIVITDLSHKISRPGYRVSFTTKVILLVTAVMTVSGTLILAFSPAVDHGTDWFERFSLAFFQAMSAMTTVGFNNIDLSCLRAGPILVFAIIMFVGASPSGTGGGVKSTSVSAVWGFVVSKLRVRKEVTFLGRVIPSYRVDSALTAVISYGVMIFIGCIILSYSEPFRLSQILFEATSAIGTVGLSTGITPSLSPVGKWVIIALMYIGRIGIITFGTALLGGINRQKEENRPRKEADLVS